jgi:GT2 family glycosyltransferase
MDKYWAVLVACHNRRTKTLDAIDRAQRAFTAAGIRSYFVIFDDGSQDGTGTDARAKIGSSGEILNGDGKCFWAKSMAEAERYAFKNVTGFTDLVWLNDDVLLDEDAISRASKILYENPSAILVGSMRDSNGYLTYGGLRKTGLHPISFSKITPHAEVATNADTFNGNFVIVPRTSAEVVGRIEGKYTHALADIDYGLRARRLGISILVLPQTYGICEANVKTRQQRISKRWAEFTGVKGGGNPHNLRRILSLTSKNAWPLWWIVTYGTWLAKDIKIVIRDGCSKLARKGN